MAVHSDLAMNPLRELDGILAPDEVHVWHAELTVPKSGVDRLFELLVPEERERASRLKLPDLRTEFLITRAFLRLTLGRYLRMEAREIHFQTTRYGKPELVTNSDLRFNLSHSFGAAVIAIARNRMVGVDVERIRENLDPIELSDRFFSRPESEWLLSQRPSERLRSFFSCWTAKEAYIKARGEGVSRELKSFSVIPRANSSRLQLHDYDPSEESTSWSVWQLELGPDLHGALAVEGEDCSVRLGRWPSVDAELDRA